MTPTEFAAIRRALGLTQTDLARLITDEADSRNVRRQEAWALRCTNPEKNKAGGRKCRWHKPADEYSKIPRKCPECSYAPVVLAGARPISRPVELLMGLMRDGEVTPEMLQKINEREEKQG